MFSLEQKKFISAEVEKILLSLQHPEMPAEKPNFSLHVDGIESWSYADIKPNHTVNNPGINPYNEIAAINKKVSCPVLIAHQNNPTMFAHQMNIEFIGNGEYDDVIKEIVNLLNEHEVRDCIYKLKEN